MDYKDDYGATGRWLKGDADLRRVCVEAAEDIASMARTLAPVRTGNYLRSIEVETDDIHDRVGAVVRADDPAASPLEFGNARTAERSILVDAAEAAGFDVVV